MIAKVILGAILLSSISTAEDFYNYGSCNSFLKRLGTQEATEAQVKGFCACYNGRFVASVRYNHVQEQILHRCAHEQGLNPKDPLILREE